MIPSILTFRWWLFGLFALAGLLIIAYFAVGGSTPTVSGESADFSPGDVFAGVGNGLIRRFDSDGVPLQDLNTTAGSKEQSGMCIDGGGNIYSTNHTAGTMSKFDLHESLISHEWVGPFGSVPQDCKIDAIGNIYVGSDDGLDEFDGVAPLRRFSPSGELLGTWFPDVAQRGTNWFDLAEDQCTILYTSDIGSIKQFDVCANSGNGTQLADFAVGLSGPCYAVRARPNSEVMVACFDQVVRLHPNGTVAQIYPTDTYDADWFLAMNLDPDGETFWTGGYLTGVIYRIILRRGFW